MSFTTYTHLPAPGNYRSRWATWGVFTVHEGGAMSFLGTGNSEVDRVRNLENRYQQYNPFERIEEE